MAAVLCAIAPNAGHAVLQLMSASGQDIHTVEARLSRAAAALHRSARAALATAPVHPRAPLPMRALAHASCAPCMHTICTCAGARVPARQDARRRGEGAAVRRGAGAGTQTDPALPPPFFLPLQYPRGRAAPARSRYAVVLGLLRKKKKDAAAAVLEEEEDSRRRSRSRSRTSQKGVTHARQTHQESAAAAVDVRHARARTAAPRAAPRPPPPLPRTLPAGAKVPAAVVGLHAQKAAASAPRRKRSRSSTSPWHSSLGRSTSRAAAASPAPPPPPPTVRAGC